MQPVYAWTSWYTPVAEEYDDNADYNTDAADADTDDDSHHAIIGTCAASS
jgi:hypothetical protein